jgi:hypothetical protein
MEMLAAVERRRNPDFEIDVSAGGCEKPFLHPHTISAPFSTPESNLSVHLYHQFFHQLATSLEWRSCSVAAVGPGVGSQRQEKGDLSNFMSTNKPSILS